MTHLTIHPRLLPQQVTVAHDPHYRPPTLAEALAWKINESSRGVRMVALSELPDHRLEEIAQASEWHMKRYSVSTFRWRGEAARLILRARKAGEVPL